MACSQPRTARDGAGRLPKRREIQTLVAAAERKAGKLATVGTGGRVSRQLSNQTGVRRLLEFRLVKRSYSNGERYDGWFLFDPLQVIALIVSTSYEGIIESLSAPLLLTKSSDYKGQSLVCLFNAFQVLHFSRTPCSDSTR
jgi:hypothetical protein